MTHIHSTIAPQLMNLQQEEQPPCFDQESSMLSTWKLTAILDTTESTDY